MRHNKKGFTLVELLVVIVILGIITAISIPLIRNVQERNRMRKYTTYMDSMKQSAKLYVDSYEEDLFGHEKSGCAIIYYSQMEEKNLLKDITVSGVSCKTDKTFVKVVKVDDKIGYASTISCGEPNNSGTVKIDTTLPEGGLAGIDTCGVDIKTIMSFSAAPASSVSINYKKRNITVKATSHTGILEDYDISYAFVKSSDKPADLKQNPTVVNNKWNKLDLNYIGSNKQKQEIENGNAIILDTPKIQTPENVTGEYYLVLRIDNLRDLGGRNWTTDPEQSKYIYFGKYVLDNTNPVFGNGSTVVSSEEGFNDIKPKLKINVTDVYSTSGTNKELRMCTSYDSDSCSKKVADIKEKDNGWITYDNDKVLDKIQSDYDGSNHKVYVTVGDAAGNYTTKSYDYKIATRYTLTYDSNGGNACNPNKKSVTFDTTAPKWGTLCTPTRDNYTFTGWNTERNGSGDTVTKDTVATSSIKVYAQWRKNKVIFRFKVLTGESLTASTTATDGTVYTWTKDSGGFVYKNGTLYTQQYDFDSTSIDLANYNNTRYLEIKKTGHKGKSGEEWKCESGCKTSGQKFSQASSSVTLSNICDYKASDCTVNLSVNWISNVCTITYSANNGRFTAHATDTVQTFNYGDAGTPDMRNANGGYYAADKTGYHPKAGAEWILNGGTTTFNQDNAYSPTDFCPNLANDNQSVTLNVNWEINQYRIHYNCNGGTGTIPDTLCNHGATCTLAANTCSWDYHKNTGWYNAASGGGKFGATTVLTGDLNVYAGWIPTKVIFQFKVNTDETVTASTTDTAGDTNTWSVNSSTRLLQKNSSLYTQSIDYDDSQLDLANYNNSKYVEIKKTGYQGQSGKEWICESGCKTTGQTFNQNKINVNPLTICDPKTADCTVTLKVNWEITKIPVTYSCCGNTTSVAATTCNYNQDCTLKAISDCTKPYYTVDGWYNAATGGSKYGSTIKVTSPTTVYGQCRKNRVIFTFKSDRNTETLNTPTTSASGVTSTWTRDSNNLIQKNGSLYTYVLDYDADTIDLPNYNNTKNLNITKIGYKGKEESEWICDSGCTSTGRPLSQSTGIDISLPGVCNPRTSDCTVALRVNWEPQNYTITYSNCFSHNNPTSYNIETNTFSLRDPSNSNFQFLGWEGTGVSSISHSVLISRGSTGNRRYVCHWGNPSSGSGNQVQTVRVTLNCNGGTGSGVVNCIKDQPCDLPDAKEYCSRTNRTATGWFTATSGGTEKSGSETFSSDTTLYAQWRKNQVIFYYRAYDSENLETPVTYGSNTYAWTKNSYNTLKRSKNGGTVETYATKVDYDATTVNLLNHGQSLKLTKTGYHLVSGASWKCTKGCNTAGMTFSSSSSASFNASDVCDYSEEDCKVYLKSNWVDDIDPECTIKKGPASAEGVDITITCEDSGSGCSSNNPTSDRIKETKVYVVKDKSGNRKECTARISLDGYQERISICKKGKCCGCKGYSYSGSCTCYFPDGMTSGSSSYSCSESFHPTSCDTHCRNNVTYSTHGTGSCSSSCTGGCKTSISDCGCKEWNDPGDWTKVSSCEEGEFENHSKNRECREVYK